MALRKYLTGTGLIGTLTSGYSMLRGANGQRFTWRSGLAWLSWGITLALTIGTLMDIRRASVGKPLSDDSPIKGKETKYYSPAEAEKHLGRRTPRR